MANSRHRNEIDPTLHRAATTTQNGFLSRQDKNKIESAILVKNNYAATTAPGVGNDSADGYSVGSEWINISSDVSYICVDSSVGAAVWNASS